MGWSKANMDQTNVHIGIEQAHPAVIESGDPIESANPPWNGVSYLVPR